MTYHAIVRRRVGRRRAKLVPLTDRILGSLNAGAAMARTSFTLGIEAPPERADEYRGSGRELTW